MIQNIEKVPLSVLMLTYNEELNLETCLQSLREWVDDVVIVDSYSTDRTIEIAQRYKVRVYQHPFEGHAKNGRGGSRICPLYMNGYLCMILIIE